MNYSYVVCVLVMAYIVSANCKEGEDSIKITPRWSLDGDNEASASEHSQTYNAGITVGLQNQPHLEILQLAETFLKLKGAIASKIYAVIQDNSDLLYSVTNFAISKIGPLYKFALNGIAILRRVVQFAVDLFGQWGLPSLTVALNKPITPPALYAEIPPISANIDGHHRAAEYDNSYGNYGEF